MTARKHGDEINSQFNNTQALESEKAYPYTIVHPSLESDMAYRDNTYYF